VVADPKGVVLPPALIAALFLTVVAVDPASTVTW